MMRTGILGGPLADRLLSRMGDPSARDHGDGSPYHGPSKLEVLLGQNIWREPEGKDVDGFEHFADPRAVLQTMSRLLRPEGRVLLSFGPTWFHPLGGHLFSVFPWAHLIFTEVALLRWRARFKHDGATRFGEVEGGLNQMTVRRFQKLVAASPLAFEAFETVPIRRLRALATPLTRELFTSRVRSRLKPRKAA
jgi:SAM-dependent methyltransferase